MLSTNPGDFNGDFLVDDSDLSAIASEHNLPPSAIEAILEWREHYGAQYYDTHREPITLPSGDVIPAIGSDGEAGIGVLSGSYDKLVIPQGVMASVSGHLEVRELRIEGTLVLDSARNSTVKAETIFVTRTGSLVSTPQEGVQHAFGLGGAAPADAQQIEQGLIVLGDLRLQGHAEPRPEGDDPDEWDTRRTVQIYSRSLEHPAHVMVAGPATYHVKHVLFDHVGRTTSDPLDAVENHVGRYAFHLHHNKGGGLFVGNAIINPAKWGVAVHFAHDAMLTANVILGATGAGISFEAGLERNITVSGNFIGNIQGNGESPYSRPAGEGGFAGDGIWLRGAGFDNKVENNVIANVSGSGIAFFARFGDEDQIQPNQMGSLWGNRVINADIGYSFYGVGEDYAIGENADYFNARGLRAERVRIGIETSYVGPMDFSQASLSGTDIGVKAGSPEWMLFEDVTLTGFSAGVQSASGFTVRDGYYDVGNAFQFLGSVAGRVEGWGGQRVRHEDVLIYQPTFGPGVNVKISLPPLDSQAQRFRNYAWQQNVVYVDDDGVRHLLYRDGQQADAVPPDYRDSRTVVEPGQTNQQLFDQYRLAFLGRIMPSDAVQTPDLGWHAPAPADTQPPLAYDTRTERLADGRLAIRWQTDEPATSQVEWAVGQLKTTEWGAFTSLDETLKTEHEVILDAPLGRISFQRYSADATGNINQQYRHGGFDRRVFTHQD